MRKGVLMNLPWLLPSADEADGINETRGISATSLREFARHLREFAEICEYLLASDSHVIADDSQISLCPTKSTSKCSLAKFAGDE